MNGVDVTYRAASLSVSTEDPPRRKSGLLGRSTGRWAVYAHGRELHKGFATSHEANIVRLWYIDGVPASDPRWKMVGGKQPSPLTDHVRAAAAS